ncbi:HD domain-containing protein [Metallumcola ferriviriculae]|uniref:HD domain-containing protein n=1 Tax=Metallumcola ferriviriculae TaxID=3039180 RepID=A0AAU0UMK3_9FIRM|nr:HD domain-containing protein [Desulfitibacteraceae bacterium MK1]
MILLSIALIASFFLEPRARMILITSVMLGFFAFMLIVTLKSYDNKFIINFEPYPAMFADIFLISALVKVSGGVGSVFHPLYIVEFILMGYFYGRIQTVIAGLLAAAGFYYASYIGPHLLKALLQIGITFATAILVGFIARHRAKVQQERSMELMPEIQAGRLRKNRKAMESLSRLASAMSGLKDVEEVSMLMDSYLKYIGHAEKVVFALPGQDGDYAVYLKDQTKRTVSKRFAISREVILQHQALLSDRVESLSSTRDNPLFNKWYVVSEKIPILREFIGDFKSCMYSPILHGDEIYGLIVVANCNHHHAFGTEEMEMLAILRHALAVYLKNLDNISKLEIKNDEIVHMAAKMVDLKDRYTHQHSQRVANIAVMIGEALGFEKEALVKLETASLLHDVGKVGIADAVLNKPGKLDDEEFNLIKAHPVVGEELIKRVSGLEEEAVWVGQHHEKFDGTGYPAGIAGANITLAGRIIAVADAYEAMTSDRAYRRRKDRREAVAEIRHNAGSQFDPGVVEAFIRVESLLEMSQINDIGLKNAIS